MSRRTDIQKLIVNYERRLQILKEKEALTGLNTSPETLIEIEDIETRLDELQAALRTEPTSDASSMAMVDDEITQELSRMAAEGTPPGNRTQIGGLNLSGISNSTITIGNISANVEAGGDIVAGDKITTMAPIDPSAAQAQLEAALAQWRTELEAIIAALDDGDDREYAAKTAAKVMDEARKGETADPVKIEGFFTRLGNMAPDIIEVTATTLRNPFAGVGLVLDKINDRIKLERAKANS